jgi:S1-C subfamily serine protease
MDISPEMLAAKDALAAALQQVLPSLPGVIGVDVGSSEDGQEPTDDPAIRVLVSDTQNVPAGLAELIANTGFPVVVIQREMTPLVDNAPHTPLIGGISIRAAHGGALVMRGVGTLGGFATDTLFGSGLVGVSCAHVIAESTEEVHQGDPIFQPDGNRQIGRLHRFQPTTDTAVFVVDGVAAEQRIADIGTYSGMAPAKYKDPVTKRGRTTELTHGKVSGVGLQPLGIGTPANSFEITVTGTDPIFCNPGDSGALIINANNQVVGILTQLGIANGKTGFATQMATDGAIIGAAESVGISF